MKIHPVIKPRNKARHNRYCGPCALSILTGQDTGECAGTIRALSGVTAVRGTSPAQLMDAIECFGFKVIGANYPPLNNHWFRDHEALHDTSGRLYQSRRNLKHAPTLAGWLKKNKSMRTSGRVFLLCVGWHWAVVSGRRYACGLTEDIVSVRKAPKRRARVSAVWEISN